MYFSDPGWLRPVLAFFLAVFGVILRFVLVSRLGGFGLRKFRTQPDEDILLRIRYRFGEMLIAWSLWILLQMVAGVRESHMTILWAPLLIVVVITASYTAKLYTGRYLVRRGVPDPASSLTTGWKGWLWVVLREIVPLLAILLTILAVRDTYPRIPDEIPVGWSYSNRSPVWMDSESGLRLLRHRTAFVYLLLFGLEGAFLIVRWARGKKEDIAHRMLTRSHWLYFLFKISWVMMFTGINLGSVMFAIDGRSIFPYLMPGVFSLALLGLLVIRSQLRKSLS